MKQIVFALLLGASCSRAQEWRAAAPGWQYQFPRDHHAHHDFKTEWWYFTGNLFDRNGRRFGFELTFFRQGIVPPAQRAAGRSRFIVDDLKFAHFSVSDETGRKFRFDQKTSRGAFGDAGFDRDDQVAWIDDWSLQMNADGAFHLSATTAEAGLNLMLMPAKRPVVHGENGLSIKASGQDHASHYYSVTRLNTCGSLTVGRTNFRVAGDSWFDHEWATNQLAPNQVGWNWLCLQLTDGTELMLYQMRLSDGGSDPASSGTFVDGNGRAAHLTSDQFTMAPTVHWKSPKTGADYPIAWRITIPSQEIDLSLNPILAEQELALSPLAYWEGAIDAKGKRGNAEIDGVGYLELSGYAGPLRILAR